MIATGNPFAQYFDKDGTPLDAGYLYFGAPNQNPQTSPIQVYFDEAGTIPAAQPIRTLNGYPSRAGTPARVYAAGIYSQTVLNKRGELVYTAATSADFTGYNEQDTIIATEGQTQFTVDFPYSLNSGAIQIYVNGRLRTDDFVQYIGYVTIAEGLSAGDEIKIIVGTVLNSSLPSDAVSQAGLASSGGSSMVGDELPVAPAYLQTISQILQGERVSLFRFLPITDALLNDFRTTTVATDYASDVQDAFNAADIGAYDLYVPTVARQIRLGSTINVNFPITVSGGGVSPMGATGPYNSRGRGSWFYLDHTGKGFNVRESAGNFLATVEFRDIGTIRNQPNPGAGWTPTANDFDFSCENTDARFVNVTLYNPTKGILAFNGNAGRLTIDGLWGQPMQIGVQAVAQLDVFRGHNIHFWPFWQNDSNVNAYTQANLSALALSRCDGPQISNFFSIFANACVAIGQSATGTTRKLQLTNGYFDICNYMVLVDGAVDGATGFFTNCVSYGVNTPSTNNWGVRILGDNCRFEFAGIEGEQQSRGLLSVEGTGNIVKVSGARINTWDRLAGGNPVMNVGAGNTLLIADEIVQEGGGSAPVIFNAGTLRYNMIRSGTASITAAATSVVVSHGLQYTPTASQVRCWFNGNPGTSAKCWVSTITATQMTINVDAAPGATISMGWEATLS